MTRSRILAALVAVGIFLGVVACGGSSPTQHCSANNTSANCVLKTVSPPPPNKRFSLFPVVARGIDFAWSCPSSAGHDFGASYLSGTSKDWTRSCLSSWPRRVFVWETSGTTVKGGASAGFADARAAQAELNALGYPRAHVDFAIDFDASASDQSQINAYFRAADSVLGLNRVGDYGGYWPTTRLCAAHLVTKSWQTYAWSGGLWASPSCAPLEQWLNGSAIDYDRAVATDYGQVPSPAPPKVKPSNVVLPSISGVTQVGQTITAHEGTWKGDTPIKFNFAWSNGTRSQTLKLTASDAGKSVSVTVGALNDAGSALVTSHNVGPIRTADFNQNFQAGYVRGFDVIWLKRHHQKAPPFTFHVTNQGAFNLGFNSGWRTAYK